MNGVVATVIGIVMLLIAAWWFLGIGKSLLQDFSWSRSNRHLRPMNAAELRLDPRWGPPFDTARPGHEAWIRSGPIAGMPSLIFAQPYPLSQGHGVVAVCAARFRTELPRLEVRRRSGIVLPALHLPRAATGLRHFDEVYEVTSENPQLVRDLLSPQLCELLLATNVPVLRIAGTHLLLLEDGRLPPPGPALGGIVQRFTSVIETLPAPIAALR